MCSSPFDPKMSGPYISAIGFRSVPIRLITSITSIIVPAPVPPAEDPMTIMIGGAIGVPSGIGTSNAFEILISSGPPALLALIAA